MKPCVFDPGCDPTFSDFQTILGCVEHFSVFRRHVSCQRGVFSDVQRSSHQRSSEEEHKKNRYQTKSTGHAPKGLTKTFCRERHQFRILQLLVTAT
jgi:hypothetical protein